MPATPATRGIQGLVTELLGASPQFAAMWAAHEVEVRAADPSSASSHLLAGPLEFECQVLHIPDTGQRLITYCAAPGSPTGRRSPCWAQQAPGPLWPGPESARPPGSSPGMARGHTITTRQGTEHVVIGLGGEKLAESDRPVLLDETGLPTRYYLPREDVRTDLLQPTDTHTTCPFKGEASYWSAEIGGEVHPDVVWSYESPIRRQRRSPG